MKKESFFDRYYTLSVAGVFAIVITALVFLSLDAMLKDYEESLNQDQIEENIDNGEEKE